MTKRLAAAATIPVIAGSLGVASWAVQAKKPAPCKRASATAPPAAPKTQPPAAVGAFLKGHCIVCHDGQSKSGGLDLTALKFDAGDRNAFAEWVKVYDRVDKGEMPPKDAETVAPAARAPFLKALAAPLVAADDARTRTEGRATWRRMNRYEYENTLRDLLGAPWLQIKDRLPEDGEAYRFNKVGDALDVSYVQMGRYLAAADYALREAMAHSAARPPAVTKRYYARDQRSFIGLAGYSVFNGSPERATFYLIGDKADVACYAEKAPHTVGDKDPLKREQEGMGMVASSYEPIEPTFGSFRAPVAGRYVVKLCANSFWAAPESEKNWWRPSRTDCSRGRTTEPISLYSQAPPRALRKIGTFDVTADPTVGSFDVYLLKGETIRPDPVRFFRSRPPAFRNPLATPEGQPGVDFHWLEVTGPIDDSWPSAGQRLMFGDLPIKDAGAAGTIEVLSNAPDADSERLIEGFLARAYRRPVGPADAAPFVKLAAKARASGESFTDSLIAAYSAILCSPEFVTLQEKPGKLDDYALAQRLAYFLWNSEPDAALRAAAAKGELHQPAVLAAQTDRMLADPKAGRFIDAFLDYWLDLRKVNVNSPDEALYPDYYLDDFLVESSLDETRAFFKTLIANNLPAKNLVDSDFVMVNERLADLYGIAGVKGSAIRKVPLPPDSPRGGLLTMASVLKVTANGTTTSPVVRGAWITERILGQPVPPPPPKVPAVEPDTRGATTIREQLAKHRSEATCRACHANIDPPGFALESFDVCGGWRDRYRAIGDGGPKVPGRGKGGNVYAFHLAQPVDASGVLPDGRKFKDIRDLKRLLAADDRQIARNLARQLVVYGTGAPIRFGDRPRIEAVLDRARPTGYGVKSVIKAIVQSDLFQEK